MLERAERDGLAAVLGDDGLSPVRVTPFLVAAALVHEEKAVPTEHPDNVVGVTDWEVAAQGGASSTSLAFLRSLTGTGSNQRASASLALAIASASESPAVAQPGNSGNTADQRFVCESNSTSNRNFMDVAYRALRRLTIPNPAMTEGMTECGVRSLHSSGHFFLLWPPSRQPEFNAKTPRREDAKRFQTETVGSGMKSHCASAPVPPEQLKPVRHGKIERMNGDATVARASRESWRLRRDHFHARRKTELMKKLLAILPGETEGADIRHPEAGNDG